MIASQETMNVIGFHPDVKGGEAFSSEKLNLYPEKRSLFLSRGWGPGGQKGKLGRKQSSLAYKQKEEEEVPDNIPQQKYKSSFPFRKCI